MFGWFCSYFQTDFSFYPASEPAGLICPAAECGAGARGSCKNARRRQIGAQRTHRAQPAARGTHSQKYYAAYSDQDDLISIGTVGLIKAIDSFKPDKGTRLATYAAKCVENEILMHFRSMKKSAHDISLEDPIDSDSEGNPLTLMDIICTPDCIADDLDLKIKSEKLRGLVIGIPDPREKAIIVMRYGLDGNEPMTQREIASMMNISRSYVSRIEKRALERLGKGMKQP